LKLKEKTYKKFLQFFEKTALKHDGNEFEIAYSEIQRETGVASITLKKGIQVLEEDGVIQVSAGRNTRYGKFKFLLDTPGNKVNEVNPSSNHKEINSSDEIGSINQLADQLKSLHILVEQLRLRIRTQEMTISVILDRLAELEDKTRS